MKKFLSGFYAITIAVLISCLAIPPHFTSAASIFTTIQFRRGTAAAWTAADSVLAAGEPGYETDTGKMKVGDGITHWSSLSYSLSGGYATLPITGSQIDNGTINLNNFPGTLRPIKALASLPVCGDSNYPEGAVVYLTSDYKLYRCAIDNAWKSFIDNTDIVGSVEAGRVTANTVISDNVITNNMLAGSIAAAKLAVSTLSAISADMGTLTAGTIQQGYTAPGDDNTTAGAGLKLTNGNIEAYGGTHSFSGTIMSSDGTYMALIGKTLTATGLTKRYPLNDNTNMTADGKIHVYRWASNWVETVAMGMGLYDDVLDITAGGTATRGVRVYGTDGPLNMGIEVTGAWPYGIYVSTTGGTGITGIGSTYGASFIGGAAGAPVIIGASDSASAPSHASVKGSLWVTSAGILYINTAGDNTWAKVGAQ